MGLSNSRKLTLGAIFRDLLIYFLPKQIIPKWLIKSLYGQKINFIFLAHPRHKNDIYATIPLFKIIKQFIPEKILLKMLSICPTYMVSKVEWSRVIQGLVISTSIMPEDLFLKREDTVFELERIIRFIRKITYDKVFVGLAAWWPIVTNSGLAFRRVLSENDRIIVTNGHTATLLSIYLTINKICELAGLRFSTLKILIIGVGKMGSAVAELLNGKAYEIGMIDRNAVRMKALEGSLLKKKPHSIMKSYIATEVFFSEEMISILSRYDIAVCTTSNINYVIKDASSLKNCIIIDDSRPEAFPRIVNPERNVAVLEGGLIKFKDIELDADFGFGKKDNVFGCMAEAIILALDGMRTIKATVGEVDYENFSKMLNFCKEYNITEGDLKSGQDEIKSELLLDSVKNKWHAEERIRVINK